MNSFSGFLAGSHKHKHLLTYLFILWTSFCYSQSYNDVSLNLSATPSQAVIGETVTFTIQIFNEGATQITELSVLNEIPSTATYFNHATAPNTSYDPATGIWEIGDALTEFTGFLQLSIQYKIQQPGVAYQFSQVQTMNEMDVDSEPGNDFLLEDDMASACVSAPHQICTAEGESVTLEAPGGYTGYEWYMDQGNGPNLVANDSIFVATQPGSYTFSVNSFGCPAICCPIILEEYCEGNEPPVANFNTGSTPVNTPIDILILDNDFDPDGYLDTNTVSITGPPNNGTVFINPDGSITYTPDGGFSGNDTLIYEVCDNGTPVLCDTAIVIITVGDVFFDLALDKSLKQGQSSMVDIGEEVTYVITVTNEGVFNATNIEVVDHIPAGLVLSPNDMLWTSLPNGEASYLIEEILAPGESISIEIILQVIYGASGQTISNVAEVTGATDENGIDGVDIDSTPNNGDEEEDDQDGEDITLIPHDPTGYIYCEKTGKIITGGTISVEGPGEIYMISDGFSGYYEFYTDGTPGIYVLNYSHPDGYPMSNTCIPLPGAFDPTGLPGPVVMGSDTLNMQLIDAECAANPYFMSFELEAGDPIIFNNNLPLQCGFIGSVVCLDEGDDLPSGNEPGLAGVTVNLFDCADTLNPIMTTITDDLGHYEFDGLVAGEYMVQFELLPGHRFIQDSGLSPDGFTDCFELDFGECDTTHSTCLYACPVPDAGPDVTICDGESIELMASIVYGTGEFNWSPTVGLNNPQIQNPVATPTSSTVYIVTYDDGLGCMNTDSIEVTVTTTCQDDLIEEDSVTVSTNCELGDPLFCFNIPYEELTQYEFELNGEPYDAEFGVCDYMRGRYYTYGSLLGFDNSGTFVLEYWNVNGVVHTAEFADMDELAQLMNSWDPLGNWEHNATARSIVGGVKQSFYSKMTIRQVNTGSVATLDLYSLFAPNSSYVLLPAGENTLIVTRLDGVKDTVFIKTACVTPDYVEIALPVGSNDTICLETNELEGTVVAIFDQCLPGFDEPAQLEVISNTNCIDVFGMYPGDTEACYVICDDVGICDTTYIYITVYNDEFHLNPDSLCTPKDISIIGEVLLNDNVPNDIVSMTILDHPENGNVVVNDDHTITYIPNEGYCNDDENEPLDQFIYEVCTRFECLSTTVYVQVKCDGLIVYNGFSPNNDGINDNFTIIGLDAYEKHKLMVFNRWGNKVLESDDYRNDWDGRWDGMILPYGTYFYLIELNGGEQWMSGYVQLRY